VRWQVLALIFAASFTGYLLRTNMSVVGERLMGDLQLSRVELGVVLSAFAWGYAIFQVPGGLWGDRIGGRRALAVAAVAWGLLTLLTAAVPAGSFALIALVVLRFAMGIAQAPLFPVSGGGMTFHWFPKSGWALPNGLSNAGLTLGASAAGPLIVSLSQAFGWRAAFAVTAPLALVFALVWRRYVTDRPQQHPRVSAAELALIEEGREAGSVDAASPGRWRDVLRNRQVLLLATSYFCSNYVFYFFFNWLFIYLVESRGFRELEGGWYAAAPWLTSAMGAVAGGILCDRLTRLRGIRRACRGTVVTGLIVAGALLLAAALADSPLVAVAWLSLCLAFQQGTEAGFWAASVSVGGSQASTACGVLNTGGNIAGGVGALLVPLIVQSFGWPAALASGAAFAMIGALLWCWIRADATAATG
jgi:ACS family glucarate transporter-like MFS transporter